MGAFRLKKGAFRLEDEVGVGTILGGMMLEGTLGNVSSSGGT